MNIIKQKEVSLKFLQGALPPNAKYYNEALQYSADAFLWVDKWLNLNCTELLKTGHPEESQVDTVERISNYPLAQLLCTPSNLYFNEFEGLKALVLVHKYVHTLETQSVQIVIAGLKIAAKGRPEWKTILPNTL